MEKTREMKRATNLHRGLGLALVSSLGKWKTMGVTVVVMCLIRGFSSTLTASPRPQSLNPTPLFAPDPQTISFRLLGSQAWTPQILSYPTENPHVVYSLYMVYIEVYTGVYIMVLNLGVKDE